MATAIPSPAPAQELAGVVGQMTCVAPGDAAGLDAMLARAGSPLAGEGATFVSQGAAAGIDPRALVAIAAHETMLETYVPAQAIRNPFGLGPGMAFARERDAIALAARTLADGYLPEGRDTLATISAKWAPLGAANDPGGLNANWTAGVGAYYAALGGDPTRPIRAGSQDAGPACAGGAAASPSLLPPAEPTGPPVVTAWGGAVPRGAGVPAVIEGFVFPLALPQGAPALYGDTFGEPGRWTAAEPGSSARSRSRPPRASTPWPRPPGPCGGRRRPSARRGSPSGLRPRAATGWAMGPWSPTRPGWARARRSPPDSPSASTRGC